MRIPFVLGHLMLAGSLVTVSLQAEEPTGDAQKPLTPLSHSGHEHSSPQVPSQGKEPPHESDRRAMEHSQIHGNHKHRAAHGVLGPYPGTREASGTGWQPDSAPHEGLHVARKDWSLMLHGFAQVIYANQGGSRGDKKSFSSNMLMFKGRRPMGAGTFAFRTMLSLEPITIGKKGYPLLLQTGETADGRHHLIDRQHPHDLLMELSMTYSLPVADDSSVFFYIGLPGEPAVGPPVFIHRFSAEENPEAPIGHHWLDSTHISYGVATLGWVKKNVKLEGSLFTGREPDERRLNFDQPRFDSYAFRFSFNPTQNWTLQASFGHLRAPEQLAPEVNTERVTFSIQHNKHWGQNNWQTLVAWGRNINRPGQTLDAFLLESAVAFRETHALFTRVERAEKNELFEDGDPFEGSTFAVGKGSLGYVYDFYRGTHVKIGVGALGSLTLLPSALKPVYGGTPLSAMLFLRLRLK